MPPAPSGFEPLARTSPYAGLLGPIYQRQEVGCLVIALAAEQKHCNARNQVHGGVLATLADIAMGYSIAFATTPPTPLVTTSLSIDYAGVARLGDWIEVHTDVQKAGRRLAFANCYLRVGDVRIARASAVFSIVG